LPLSSIVWPRPAIIITGWRRWNRSAQIDPGFLVQTQEGTITRFSKEKMFTEFRTGRLLPAHGGKVEACLCRLTRAKCEFENGETSASSSAALNANSRMTAAICVYGMN
jgi:hypothetical protein